MPARYRRRLHIAGLLLLLIAAFLAIRWLFAHHLVRPGAPPALT